MILSRSSSSLYRTLLLCTVASLCFVGGILVAGPVSSVQSITEREIQRRQKMLSDAETQLQEALLIDGKGEHAQAAQQLKDIYDGLPDAPTAANLKMRVREAYTNAACAEAADLLDRAEYARANEMLESVLDDDMDPNNAWALKLKKRAADPDRYPPALSPKHLENTKKVNGLLILAASAIDIGDYNKARTTYQQVLAVDPYNVAARRGLERAEQHIGEYLDAARDEARSKALLDVSKHWEEAVPPSSDLGGLFSSASISGTTPRGKREELEKKLRTIRIPKAEFNGATLDETLEYLRVTSRSNDPDQKGVSFVLNVDAETRARPLSLSVSDLPLEELLRYITELSGTAYRVEENAVSIFSLSQQATSLIQKAYRVPPDFIQKSEVPAAPASDPFAPANPNGGGATGVTVSRMGAKEFLASRGVPFPEGASASFSPSTSTLIVRTSAEGLNLVDALVDSVRESAPKQARIMVRVVEVSQENMVESGVDTVLGKFNLPGSDRVFASGGTVGNQGDAAPFDSTFNGSLPWTVVNGSILSAGLRSSGAILGQSSIDSEIAHSKRLGGAPTLDSRSPTQFTLGGVTTDPQFGMAIRAIEQKKGVDVMQVPTAVAKSGQKAVLRSGREFPYPTEFDPPQIPQSVGQPNAVAISGLLGITTTNQNSTGPVTPATPTAFEKKEIGVTLEVEPTISPDGRTVDISIAPTLVEFEGFIDYGSDIKNAIDNVNFDPILFAYVRTPGPVYLQPNDILQPVFKRSSLGSPVVVTIYDGSTILIGGLVDERVTDVNDKVPLIGDIPLVGRLWQSKVKQVKKKALMFFVTVDVLDAAGQKLNHTPPATASN